MAEPGEAGVDIEYVYVDEEIVGLDERPELYREALSDKMIELIRSRGWRGLTDLQIKSIEYVTRGYNTLVTAPTGSGKTEAVLIPILEIMSREGLGAQRGVYLLYITPMKALINDLYKRISWWAEKTGLVVGRKHGDTPARERVVRLKRVPHILITTPESLQIDLDWSLRFVEHYSSLRWVVIDEVHELVNSKRGVQLAVLLERLRRVSGRDFQRILLSATVGDPGRILDFFQGSSSRPRAVVSSRSGKRIRVSIEKIEYSGEDVFEKVSEEIEKVYEPLTIVFVNSRYAAERLHESLEKRGIGRVYVHHSSVSSRVKEDVEERMRSGEADIVIATKTLELGVDIGSVKRVVLYRSPGQAFSLIQRIGRSGHTLEGTPEGVVIVDNDVEVVEVAALAEMVSRGVIERPLARGSPRDVVARTILGMALRRLVDLEEVFSVIKSTSVYRDMSYEEFAEVVDILVEKGVLERFSDNSVRTSGRFYTIWSFENRPGSKSFSEFFTYINDSDVYLVKRGEDVVGALDEFFVYRALRAGDVIRLSGRLWRIVRIDDNNRVVEVVETDSREGLIPIWYGDTAVRSRETALTLYRIIREGIDRERGAGTVIERDSMRLVSEALSSIKRWFRRHGVEIPSRDLMVVEDHGREKVLLYPFGDRLAEAVGYLLLNEAVRRVGRAAEVRISAYGVSLTADGVDPVELLLDIVREDRVSQAIESALRRCPRLRDKIKEIQYSFGVSGGGENDEFIVREAVRQLARELEDDYSIEEFLRDLYRGVIRVVRVRPREPSPIAERVMSLPPTRVWLRDLSYMIYRALKGLALTTSELAEMLELPEDTIESKLKDMRREGPFPVVQFRDVSSNEVRWALVEDLEEIVRDPLFTESFSPLDPEELVEIAFRSEYGGVMNRVIVRAGDLLSSENGALSGLSRYEEVYELRVSLYGDGLSRKSVAYYNVRREALRHMILNGVAYLQRNSD